MSWQYASIVKCQQTFSDGVLRIFLGGPDNIPELLLDYGSVHTQFMKLIPFLYPIQKLLA
jgi:hypothetical protein